MLGPTWGARPSLGDQQTDDVGKFRSVLRGRCGGVGLGCAAGVVLLHQLLLEALLLHSLLLLLIEKLLLVVVLLLLLILELQLLLLLIVRLVVLFLVHEGIVVLHGYRLRVRMLRDRGNIVKS